MQNLENIEVYWKPIMLYWTPIKVNIANIFTLFMRIRLKFANPLMYKFHSTSKEWIERTEKPKSIERTIEQLCGCSTNKEKQKLKIRRILYSGIFSLVSSSSFLWQFRLHLIFIWMIFKRWWQIQGHHWNENR